MANKLKFSLEDMLVEAKRTTRRPNNDERMTLTRRIFSQIRKVTRIFLKNFQFREGTEQMNWRTN